MLIRVTGYIETDDLEDSEVDLSHPTGVSEEFFNAVVTGAMSLPVLEDMEFELIPDQYSAIADPVEQPRKKKVRK